MDSTSFSGTITKEEKKGGWTFVAWPNSKEFLGTGQATKVMAKVAGHEFAVTCLPRGDGTHFIPLNTGVLKAIGKAAGDGITLEVRSLK